MCQIILRGISVAAIASCYFIALVFVLISLVMVNGWGQLWSVFYVVIFFSIAFEFERSMRISFFQYLETKESEKRKIDALRKEQQLEQELAAKKHEMDLNELAACIA